MWRAAALSSRPSPLRARVCRLFFVKDTGIQPLTGLNRVSQNCGHKSLSHIIKHYSTGMAPFATRWDSARTPIARFTLANVHRDWEGVYGSTGGVSGLIHIYCFLIHGLLRVMNLLLTKPASDGAVVYCGPWW